MGKVTVRMVGEVSGVSHATVSRVLNHDIRVHPVTRERVIAAARHLGYCLEPGNGRRTVALIISSSSLNGYVSSVLMRVMEVIRECGYRAELISDMDIELLNARAVCGAIAVSLDGELNGRWGESCNLPLVRMNHTSNHADNIYSVNSDGMEGMALAIEHLRRHGHHKIAFVTELGRRSEMSLISRRYEGFVRAMRSAGIDKPEDLCFFGAVTDMPDFHSLIASGVSALIAPGELCGIRVACELNNRNIRVPDDLSLVAMEYPEISENMIPPHTALSQDFQVLAHEAVSLLDMLVKKDFSATDRLVPYFLIERHSVAARRDT